MQNICLKNQSQVRALTITWVIFEIYTVIYTISPSYTKVLGHPIYRLASMMVFAFAIVSYGRGSRFVSKNLFVLFSTLLLTRILPFAANGEMDRYIIEIIQIYIPLIAISLVMGNNRDKLESIISIMIVTSLIICVFGIVEEVTRFNVFSLVENYAFANPRLGSISTERWGIYRIEQGFNTSLTYAMYLQLCFGLTFYRIIRAPKKGFYFFAALLQIANLVLTMCRGILLVFIVQVFLLVILNRKQFNLKRVAVILLATILSITVAIRMIPALLDAFTMVFQSAISIVTTGSGGANDDDSISQREGYQAVAYEALKNPRNAIFGVGEYGLREMRTIDNNWLAVMSAYGILGMIGYVFILGAPILKSISEIRKRSGPPENITFYKCMFCTILAYAMSLFTVAQMEEVRTFYVLWGLTLFYSNNESNIEPEYC
ncbi:O-antigen ligase family protein [Ruthenibacterium lactatiformans]|uniref:O-antigen ligase family protein n=1 Tax=Ruthenibacterium lactatiformans TaxID=1550024 RepID=UPI001967B30C|nr:O-antigen ligase family protein [Ruthenibacterium lactatiformans]MBN3007027.1 O-antigen ligase family protein [Ruthenibacterium lactatiformans]